MIPFLIRKLDAVFENNFNRIPIHRDCTVRRGDHNVSDDAVLKDADGSRKMSDSKTRKQKEKKVNEKEKSETSLDRTTPR